MKILIACEYSGRVREAFRNKGHGVWSCDLEPSEDNSPYHHQGDVFEFLKDKTFDMLIGHPPCTYLTIAGTRHWNNPGRAELRKEALEFFIKLYNLPIDKIVLENPVGYINTNFMKPSQIIHPYYFAEPYKKRTCLWIKGLPNLTYKEENKLNFSPPIGILKTIGKLLNWCDTVSSSKEMPRWKVRSRTFQSIANAMAEQWG